MTRQDLEERYWSVKFASMPYEVFAHGDTPFTAISEARKDIYFAGRDTETPLPDLKGALVRRAVYKEWNYGTEHFTNGGRFIEDTSKPCVECGTPVPFHTHKAELGFCQPCQSAYFDEGINE